MFKKFLKNVFGVEENKENVTIEPVIVERTIEKVIDPCQDMVNSIKKELEFTNQKLSECQTELNRLIQEKEDIERQREEELRLLEEERIRKEREYEEKRRQFEKVLSIPENMEIVNFMSQFGFDFKYEPTVLSLDRGDARFDFDFITGKISKTMGLTDIGKVLPEGPERLDLINQFLQKHLF